MANLSDFESLCAHREVISGVIATDVLSRTTNIE